MTADPLDDDHPLQAKLAKVHELAANRGRTAEADPEATELIAGTTLSEIRAGRWSQTVPSILSWAQLDDFAPPDYEASVQTKLTEWSRTGGRNLIIYGPVGVGKSHAAVAASRWSFDHGLDLAFWPAIEMFDGLRPDGPPDLMDELSFVDRLIIDDVGTEKVTEWTRERFYAIVNRRWLEELPTIFTTNLDVREDLEPVVGPRMFSRMVGGALGVRLNGRDRRRKVQ